MDKVILFSEDDYSCTYHIVEGNDIFAEDGNFDLEKIKNNDTILELINYSDDGSLWIIEYDPIIETFLKPLCYGSGDDIRVGYITGALCNLNQYKGCLYIDFDNNTFKFKKIKVRY